MEWQLRFRIKIIETTIREYYKDTKDTKSSASMWSGSNNANRHAIGLSLISMLVQNSDHKKDAWLNIYLIKLSMWTDKLNIGCA